MARTEIPVVAFTRAGATMTPDVGGDTANGHTMQNDGHVGLIVDNTDTSAAHNVTIRLARTVDGQSVVPRVVQVDANSAKCFGPFDTSDYGSAVSIDVDSASLTLIAVRVS